MLTICYLGICTITTWPVSWHPETRVLTYREGVQQITLEPSRGTVRPEDRRIDLFDFGDGFE